MIIVWILVVFIGILGAPLFSVIAVTALINFAQTQNIMIVPQEIANIATMPLLHSIPMFTFAGYLLARSNASKRLVRLTKASFGWMPGGLAIVTLLVCSVFTAFTGASGVTIVALGGLLLPALLSEKYKEKYSLGLVTTSGSIGLLFPPSLPIILFGVIASVSIEKLFVAGIIPGLIIIAVYSIYSIIYSIRNKIEVTKFSFKELKESLWEVKWELPLPILLFAGIYSGKLAVSDAAAFTVIYIFIVEVLIIKDVKFKDLPKIMNESMVLVGAIILILSCSLAATNYIIDAQIPQKLFETIKTFITNKWMFLIILNIFLLIAGSILELFSSLVIIVPLILPIAEAYNVNLIHLGIIFLANLEIGFLLPPFGMNLFIASLRFGKPVVDFFMPTIRFLILSFIALLLITYVPAVSTWFLKKPSIVGQWEYRDDSGKIDTLYLKAGGFYIRKQGNELEKIQTTYGKYKLGKDELNIQTSKGIEKYKYEIFNDGKRLLLKNLSPAAINNQEVSSDSYSWEDGELSNKDGVFYTNLLNPPITEDYGNFVGKWIAQDVSLEFLYNGLANYKAKDDKLFIYRYKLEPHNKLKLIVYSHDYQNTDKIEEQEFNYKFNDSYNLILKNKNISYLYKLTDSSCDN